MFQILEIFRHGLGFLPSVGRNQFRCDQMTAAHSTFKKSAEVIAFRKILLAGMP